MVRNTRDVDILIRRADFDAVKTALEAQGFIDRHVNGIDVFLDSEGTKAGEGVYLLFAGERVRPGDPAPMPEVTESEDADRFRVISLDALVRTKLIAFRTKDRTHLGRHDRRRFIGRFLASKTAERTWRPSAIVTGRSQWMSRTMQNTMFD